MFMSCSESLSKGSSYWLPFLLKLDENGTPKHAQGIARGLENRNRKRTSGSRSEMNELVTVPASILAQRGKERVQSLAANSHCKGTSA